MIRRITENTKIGELIQMNPEISSFLTGIGMHCIGCPSSQNESIGEAAEVHGMDVDDLLEDIKGFMEYTL